MLVLLLLLGMHESTETIHLISLMWPNKCSTLLSPYYPCTELHNGQSFIFLPLFILVTVQQPTPPRIFFKSTLNWTQANCCPLNLPDENLILISQRKRLQFFWYAGPLCLSCIIMVINKHTGQQPCENISSLAEVFRIICTNYYITLSKAKL